MKREKAVRGGFIVVLILTVVAMTIGGYSILGITPVTYPVNYCPDATKFTCPGNRFSRDIASYLWFGLIFMVGLLEVAAFSRLSQYAGWAE